MWQYETDERKYSVFSNRFIIQMTGDSIRILERETGVLLKQYQNHNDLYTGDISPDETQCFALENGKHFYVYSLETLELVRQVTFPGGYQCIDMYGRYTEDGTQIRIPVNRWVEGKTPDGGHYEYVMCHYDAKTLALSETVRLDDPTPYCWEMDDSFPEPEVDAQSFQKMMDAVSASFESKDFLGFLLGMAPPEERT